MHATDFDLARAEYNRGNFRSALQHLQKLQHKTSRTAILLAETLRQLGQFDEAIKLAMGLTECDDPNIASRAFIVRGEIVSLTQGVASALPLLERGVELAISSGNADAVCRARLRLYAQLIGFRGAAVNLELNQELWSDLLRAGDLDLLTEYHVFASNHEAARGRLQIAGVHAALARSHLRLHRNDRLQANALIAESGRAFVESDLPCALQLAREARIAAEESGDLWLRFACSATLSFLLAYSGNQAESERVLRSARCLAAGLPLAEFAVLSTSVHLSLLDGDLDGCRSLLDQALEYIARLEGLRGSSYGLSILHTHTRLEATCGRWEEVRRIAGEGLALAAQAGDPLYKAHFCAALAESHAETGDMTAAVNAVRQALEAFLFPPPAIRAELDRTLAVILDLQGQHAEAARLLGHARHTAGSIGNAILLKEIAATARHVGTPAPGAPEDRAGRDLPLVALLDAADRPDVLGRLLFDHLRARIPDVPVAICRHGAGAIDVIEAGGWTQAEAAAASRGGDDSSLEIALGDNSAGRYAVAAGRPESLDACRALLDARKVVAAALALQQARAEAKKNQSIWSDRDFEIASGAIYLAPPMLEILRDARRVAPINVPVLLTGETGVGKEVVARLVHDASNRAAKPFIPFNCGAVPREMLESQLFGYRRGAFTGAHESFSGVIRAATGGTVFLDEIGDIPPEIQPKLLRFLETGEVHPLGEPAPTKVDVRIIAATNRPLDLAVAERSFREDLYYRLNVVPLRIPPLRERREEIPALASQFLRRYADEFNRGALTMTPETMEYLATYAWPGNVRQLLNEMRRIAALAEPDSAITPRMLSADLTRNRTVTVPRPAEGKPAVGIQLDQPLPMAVATLEKALIERALEMTHGRVEDAAKRLGISRKGLFLKRRRLAPRARSA